MDADAAVNTVFPALADAFAGGKTVSIPGFGTFSTGSRLVRQNTNPRTGKGIDISASNSPSFKDSLTLHHPVH